MLSRVLKWRKIIYTTLLSSTLVFSSILPVSIASAAVNSNQISVLNGFQAKLIAQGGSNQCPDDITTLGGNIFVAYQNGVGSKGTASATGNTDSTIVEYDNSGKTVNNWKVTGKVDGMTGDPANDRVLATVNEDANSSMYIIKPSAVQSQQVQHITFAGALPNGGGTDSIAIQDGNIYISASNPSADAKGNFTNPALYQVTINGTTATTKPALMGNATAIDAVTGNKVTLNLSDPDSNNIVPAISSKYAGDVVLDSQGDSELIFIQNPGASSQKQTLLSLGTQINDVEWATSSSGTLYITDNSNNAVYAITGNFTPGTVFVACPKDSGVAGFVGTLDLSTGTIHPFAIGFTSPCGLLFMPQETISQGI